MDKYYSLNKDKMNKRSVEYQKEKRLTDPFYRIKINLRRRIRNMKLENKPSTLEILGADYNFVYHQLASTFTEGMSFDNYGQWHVDHKIPLNSANTDEEKLKLLHYTNLQALWSKDNISKGYKVLDTI